MKYSRNCDVGPDMQVPEGMCRIALGIEYAGADYYGFQKQPTTDNTVQADLEKAFSRIACEDISLVCAGRTDSGVHATAQVIHFDTLSQRPMKAWVQGVNTHLPGNVRVLWAKPVGFDFHARFSARQRTYRYILRCGPVRSAVLAKQVTHTPYDLDFGLIEQASNLLIGEHDFSSFRTVHCQAKNPVRTITRLKWFKQGDLLVMEIQANAFLQHMVRNIVGSLIEVGRGKYPPEWIAEVLTAKDRAVAGPTALPWGLYLVGVDYAEQYQLPAQLEPTRFGPAFLAS